MYSTVDGDGMVNIMDTQYSSVFWKMFGVSEDGDLAYTGSYGGSSMGQSLTWGRITLGNRISLQI